MHNSNTARTPISDLAVGWLSHFLALLCVGFYQMDMQHLIDEIFNTPLMWLIHSLTSAFSSGYFMAVNHLGNGNIAGILMLCLIVVAWRKKDETTWKKALYFSIGASLMAGAAKTIVAATRPHLWPSLEHASGSSFPSSHAIASLGLAFIASWVFHEDKYRILRVAFFVAAISCGIARVYIGVHRPSDILLSWLIVISWNYWVTRCLPENNTSMLTRPA